MNKEFFGGGGVSVSSRDFVESSMDFLGFDFLPILLFCTCRIYMHMHLSFLL